ncbi:MAG: GAF domain-containing protein, partial [Pedobacter sp.]
MQAITVSLVPGAEQLDKNALGIDVRFSLQPFIRFIERKIEVEQTAKVNFYRYILEQFKQYPELSEQIASADAQRYTQLYELIYTALSPILNEESEQFWALGAPLTPCFYYGTSGFYSIMMDFGTNKVKKDLKMPPADEILKSIKTTFYNLLLSKFYNFTLTDVDFTVRSIIDPETHLLKYYRMNVDTRFMDIESLGELPELSLQKIKDGLQDENDTLNILGSLLPPDKFKVEGISVVSLTDVTGEYALESIKNVIIEHNDCAVGSHDKNITIALQTLVGSDQVEFGILPYLRLNDKTVVNDHSGFQSIIIEMARQEQDDNIDYQLLLEEYLAHPRRLIFPEIVEDEHKDYPMLRLLWNKGIRSYALFPLYYSGRLVGCLELYAKDPSFFNSSTLSKIESAFPLLAQLFQNIITAFNAEISAVITEKFTSLQPAVQWRFYQAAFNYLNAKGLGKKLPVESIFFKGVYPFYGAVDIKDSSIERNLAIRKDLYSHFDLLETTLCDIKSKVKSLNEKTIPSPTGLWNHKEFDELSDREILRIEDYLLRQLPAYLHLLKDTQPEVSETVDNYFSQVDPQGALYKNRLEYEKSMQSINRTISTLLEEFNIELQEVYPCYFEKFRTDGVEFDIYLGEAIAHLTPMPADMVQTFRSLQLAVIAKIAKA